MDTSWYTLHLELSSEPNKACVTFNFLFPKAVTERKSLRYTLLKSFLIFISLNTHVSAIEVAVMHLLQNSMTCKGYKSYSKSNGKSIKE